MKIDFILQVNGDSITILTSPPKLEAPNNFIVTSKYTVFNFLFKNIFEQFQNYANLYYLAIGIIQIVPQTTTTGGYLF